MAAAAEDAHERVEQLIVLTERLTGLIALAAQAFEQRRPQDALRDVEETSRLAAVATIPKLFFGGFERTRGVSNGRWVP